MNAWVITPRYERTTMNDYWEHTYDIENTYRLVEFMLGNKWNFGNPNMPDRADKVLRIDPTEGLYDGLFNGRDDLAVDDGKAPGDICRRPCHRGPAAA